MFDRVSNPMQKAVFDQLQIWDQLDIILSEKPDTGFIWVLDPVMHGDQDDFFAIIDQREIREETKKRNQERRGKRIFYLQFYKEGEYAINFVRIKESLVSEVMKVGYRNSRKNRISEVDFYDRNAYDNKFQILVNVKGIEGKIEAF
eukprot:403351109